MKPQDERFWSKVDKQGPVPEHRPELGPCWVWTGSNSGGKKYGQVKRGSRVWRAHKYAWLLTRYRPRKNKQLDHVCMNQRCVKTIADEHGPAHLQTVTASQNVKLYWTYRRQMATA